MTTIAHWLSEARARLEKSGCPDPAIDARWLAEDVLEMSAPELRFEGNASIEAGRLASLNSFLERRASGEPVQYILNRSDFMGLRFFVDDRVLIPRQDTETLVETVIVALQKKPRARLLDLCCGSGAIGLSIKSLCPHVDVTLSDISRDALDVTRRNAKSLDTEVRLCPGDLFDAVRGERFDFIVSNPPYIPRAELNELQREVRFEPELALDGGDDGLDIYRRIAEGAAAHITEGGSVFLEVGQGQARDVLELLRASLSCADSGVVRDLNNIERIVWARSN